MTVFAALRAHAAARPENPFATHITLRVEGRCPGCGATCANVGRLPPGDGARTDSAAVLDALDQVLRAPPPLRLEGEGDDELCACGAPRISRAPEAVTLVRPLVGTGASLVIQRRRDGATDAWRIIDGAAPWHLSPGFDDAMIHAAFGRHLCVATAWRDAILRGRDAPEVARVEPGCWLLAAPDREALRGAVESLVASEPACVVVALSGRRGPARSAWMDGLPDDLRERRCAAAFAIDRERFASCAALAWERERGCRAVIDGDLLTLWRGEEHWGVRVDESCAATGRAGLSLAEGVREALDEVWRRLDALDGAWRALRAARPSARFVRDGDAAVALHPDGARGSPLSMRALAFETPAGTEGFERAVRFACDRLPPWADPTGVCPCGAPVLFSVRLMPAPIVAALGEQVGPLAVLAAFPAEEPVAASVVVTGCDLHAGVATEEAIAAHGLDAADLSRRIRHDAAVLAMPFSASLHTDAAGRGAIVASGPWVASAMLDDQHLSALHRACGEPLRARVVRAVTVTPDAMVVFDPAMSPDDVDPLLALAAERGASTARMLVSRDARVDALPLGRYLAVDPSAR